MPLQSLAVAVVRKMGQRKAWMAVLAAAAHSMDIIRPLLAVMEQQGKVRLVALALDTAVMAAAVAAQAKMALAQMSLVPVRVGTALHRQLLGFL